MTRSGVREGAGWGFKRNADASVTVWTEDGDGQPQERHLTAREWSDVVNKIGIGRRRAPRAAKERQ